MFLFSYDLFANNKHACAGKLNSITHLRVQLVLHDRRIYDLTIYYVSISKLVIVLGCYEFIYVLPS